MQGEQRARTIFLWLWTLITAAKLVVAARLPLFVDEAFYWQEGQHLAAAYSDLPGLTAWLARLGVEIGGHHVLALRLPFLAIGALLPLLVARIATRWFGNVAGWQAGSLTLLMPLSATLGLLAVPDVPMALAAVICLHAGARLLHNVDASSAMKLALGLLIGALSHYRFIGVIGVGFIALLALPQGRRMLADPRVWVALAVGVLAWLPLLAWNADNHDAGLKFQVVERHPWTFEWDGLWFLVIQPMLVTPILCIAMWKVALAGTRSGGGARVQWRYFGLVGGVSTLGIFLLGFFTDVERISFHWPLPGYLALLVAVPVVLNGWPRWLRRTGWWLAAAGTVLAFGYYLMASTPALREQMAGSKYYRATLPAGSRWPWRCVTNCGRCRRARVCWRATSRSVPNWASSSATVISRCCHIRSTTSMGGPHSWRSGTCCTKARAVRRCCWCCHPATSATAICWRAITPSASRWGRCRRRAWSAAIMVSSASCCSGCRCSARRGPA